LIHVRSDAALRHGAGDARIPNGLYFRGAVLSRCAGEKLPRGRERTPGVNNTRRTFSNVGGSTAAGGAAGDYAIGGRKKANARSRSRVRSGDPSERVPPGEGSRRENDGTGTATEPTQELAIPNGIDGHRGASGFPSPLQEG
jgi:hypothetical protein